MSKLRNKKIADEFNKPVDVNSEKDPEVNLNPIKTTTADGNTVILDLPNTPGAKSLNMQVTRKGSGFPMIQPNPNTPEVNRAGRSPESNTLTNDPNINQPMDKVAATTAKRENMFGDIASSQGTMNPVVDPNKGTQQASIFPQAQQRSSFGLYDGPSQAKPDFLDLDKDGDKSEPMKQAAGDAPSMKLSDEFKRQKQTGVKAPTMYDGPSKALVGNQKNLNEGLKAAIEATPGMYDGPSMRSAFKAFENDHMKTKVTKSNLKATERDDAAHMDYLKRDIKYDAKHGGSKKQMLDDEKHISKLAGDLKYDHKKKRKYDNV